ncbi:unnamed protein product [Rotaria magnacalcarata]|uniref:Uncharacterized protein n=1 Tax=Rotaria magnacalcarata TaxID=392030 RepID=A0A816WUH6_9BILA|nr:unnamed protein product [Rotaria magnacalcarata]
MAEQLNNENSNAPVPPEETTQTSVLVVEIVNERANDQNTMVMARNDENAVSPSTPIQEPEISIQTGNTQQLQEVSGPPVESGSVFDNQPVESESHRDEPTVVNLFAPHEEFFNMASYEMELSSQIEDATDYDYVTYDFDSFSQRKSDPVSIANHDDISDYSLSLLESPVSNDDIDEIQRTQVIQPTDNSHHGEYMNSRPQFSTVQLSTTDEERLPGHGSHTEATQSYSRTGSSCSDPSNEATDTRTQMQPTTISPSSRGRSFSFERTFICDIDPVPNIINQKRRLSMY